MAGQGVSCWLSFSYPWVWQLRRLTGWSDREHRRGGSSKPIPDSLQAPKVLMTFLLNTDTRKILVHWPYKWLWLFGKLLFMETWGTSKHFNDVYYSNSTCPSPCLHTPKKINWKREWVILYPDIFSWLQLWSLQCPEKYLFGEWFREWCKVEWKRFLESLYYRGVLSPYLTPRNSHSWILAYHKELFFSVLDST